MSHKSGNLVAKLMTNEVFKDENCTFSIEETPTVIFEGRYVVMQEKLPNYVVPDLTDFKEKLRARLLFSDALVNIMEV
ncbi:hypothetical protein PVK06_015866 [Gossypium arboreum]|uniref:Uncharacterized protein n=1 Tax=Gossypium arboreum TaxID=29729 RepID=A0ABR0PYU2_GOSAR|nr:hypothetical protein PVK06_015866 [Gossypium arboreum]